MYWHKVSCLRSIGPYLIARGVRPADLLDRHDLPKTLLLDHEAWVHRDLCFHIAADISHLTDDPWLGLHAMELLPLEDLGEWSLSILRARSLGEGIRTAAANIGLIQTGTQIVVQERGDWADLGVRFVGCANADSWQHDLANLSIIRALVRMVQASVDSVCHLTCSRPPETQELERLLQPALQFGASWNHVTFRRDALALPLRPAGDRRVRPAGRAERTCDTATAALNQVRHIIKTGRPTVQNVAGALAVSVRSLQRQLQSWGVTFEALVDQYRQISAVAELRRANRSITDIAFDLGYSDSAHFSRAFRRWTGICPRDFRPAAASLNWRSDRDYRALEASPVMPDDLRMLA